MKRQKQRALVGEQLERRMMLSAATAEVLGVDPYQPPQHDLYRVGEFLTKAAKGTPLAIATNYLRAHARDFGLSADDLAGAIVTDQYTTEDTGVTHIYLRQAVAGLEVRNANIHVNVMEDGRILSAVGGFVAGLGRMVHNGQVVAQPLLSALGAVSSAAGKLGVANNKPTTLLQSIGGAENKLVLADADLSLDPIPAKLHYVATEDGVKLAWDLVVRTPDGDHWYNMSVDSISGATVAASDWIDHATYNVYPMPVEAPNDGSRSVLTNPHDPTASPFGWHDTNGAAGAEFTDTRGNNVSAQEDVDANDTGGVRPSGGAGLDFNFPIDLAQPPSSYQSAATTNLFYWNNLLHDVHHYYGFTSAAGNFQTNTYGGGGVGNDAVQADAQDGEDVNNANFGTPPDGLTPRMQMFVFNITSPNRDGDLDAGIITHEYGHGVSNRLTGGPANSNALDALQSGGMGEGWSDWWALMFMQKPSDTKLGAYGMGTYVLGQTTSGAGIRRFPYSFNMATDPLTIDNFGTSGTGGGAARSTEVHNVGEIWATTLWDMSWLLIDKHGYDTDIAHGYDAGNATRNGGNNLALKLVMDGLKLQPANPSFKQARDAILQADQVLTGGANSAEIWTAFARRGMGFSFVNTSSSGTSVTPAFDVPNPDPMVLSSTPTGSAVAPISSATFTFNEPMNAASFSVASDVVSFTGPGGVNLLPQITGFAWDTTTTLRINFNAQSAVGSYSIVIGPSILAADNGNPMNQDIDATPGEIPADRYTGNFQVISAIYAANMNANPGWTMTGQWAFGDPLGGGGTSHGVPDPNNGATGTNVIGVNLAGDYSTAVGAPFYATTPAINCSGFTNVTLDFQRWLNTDWNQYVGATVEVSNNGSTWTTVFSNPVGFDIIDTSWQHLTYDISAIANGQPTVFVRWGYQVKQGGAFAYSGWNIDDVYLLGTSTGTDTAGPKVSSSTPNGIAIAPQSTLDFTFDESMDTTSFSVASDVASFTGPGGVNLKPQVTGFSWIGTNVLRVQFNAQSTVGSYSMVIGPGINDDGPSFNPMNQDNDSTNGEAIADQYTASFSIPLTLYATNMNVNPGWTFDAGSAPHVWQYGTPTGGGTGGLDPTSGRTGTNVVGFNLTGDYPDFMSAAAYATTPAFNTTGYQSISVNFWRWLGVESSLYDQASVEAFDGTTWSVVWSHAGGTVNENAWSLQTIALPAGFNNKTGVRLRWGIGPTDDSVTYQGWNLDDVYVTGTPLATNTISGKVFQDNDGDAIFDAGEPTMNGVTVWRDDDNDGALDGGEPTQVTSGAGDYSFAGLVDGTYHIRQQQPAGYVRTTAAVRDVTFPPGPGTGQHFGNFPLSFTGTTSNDTFTVSLIGGTTVQIVAPGGTYSVAKALLTGNTVTLNGSSNNDLFQLQGADALPKFSIIGGSGTDELSVTATGLNANGTSVGPAGNEVALYSQTETLTFNSSTGAITGDLNGLNLRTLGTVQIQTAQHLASLQVDGLTTAFGQLLCTSVAVGASGRLNMRDNDLLVNYAGSSPLGSWNGSTYTGISGLLRDDGLQEIYTSLDFVNSTTRVMGVREASAYFGLEGSATEAWNGDTVDATTVIVKYTYSGDIDLNGEINGDDYFFIDSNVVNSGSVFGYDAGDINFDGEINGDDYFWLDSQITSQGPPL